MADKYVDMIQEHSKKFTLDYENILTSVKDQSLVRSKQALDNIENEVKKQLEDSKSAIKEEMSWVFYITSAINQSAKALIDLTRL